MILLLLLLPIAAVTSDLVSAQPDEPEEVYVDNFWLTAREGCINRDFISDALWGEYDFELPRNSFIVGHGGYGRGFMLRFNSGVSSWFISAPANMAIIYKDEDITCVSKATEKNCKVIDEIYNIAKNILLPTGLMYRKRDYNELSCISCEKYFFHAEGSDSISFEYTEQNNHEVHVVRDAVERIKPLADSCSEHKPDKQGDEG